MKKILIIILLAFILFSCEDFLVENPKSIAVETFYNTQSEMDAAIGAAYSPLRGWDLFGFIYPVMIECFSDYQYGRGSYAPNNNFEGLNGTNISRTNAYWNLIYIGISRANLVVMNAPDATELTDSEITEAIGEAKFIRAFYYFTLLKNWGGVPIRTEDNFNELSVGKSSEEEVYQLIVSDLKYAETNLPNNEPVMGRACKWSAKTLLADAYFYMNDYNEAASKSREVIESGKYSLVPVEVLDDFYDIFGADVVSSSEEIFYIKNSHDDGTSYPMMLHYSGDGYYGAGGWGGLYVDSTDLIMSTWDQNDLRRQLWYNWDISAGPTTLLTLKFIDVEAPASSKGANDFPLYRYGDVLLLNAEAECHANGSISEEAVEKLNMVHRRAYGYDPLSTSPVDFKITDYDIDSFVDLIVRERSYETVGEGKRWFDLKRLGASKLKEIIKTNTGIDVVDKHLLFPIPDDEFALNEALDPATDQNPGY